MADSAISALPRASSGATTMIVPIANLSASSTQGIPIQALLRTRMIGRDVSSHTVNNSVTTTSIYSVNIPANSMGTDGIVRTRIAGEYFHSVGAATTMNLRVGLSTTTMYQDTSVAMTVSATSRPVRIDLDLANNGTTASQVLSGYLNVGAAGATTGQGDFSDTGMVDTGIRGLAAIDSTSNMTLDVFVTHSAASTLVTYVSFFGYSEIV